MPDDGSGQSTAEVTRAKCADLAHLPRSGLHAKTCSQPAFWGSRVWDGPDHVACASDA
jgi:hypothetical protein